MNEFAQSLEAAFRKAMRNLVEYSGRGALAGARPVRHPWVEKPQDDSHQQRRENRQ